MKILKTHLLFLDGTDSPCDTIEHEGKLWLVPYWLDTPDGRFSRPQRIVRLDTLPIEKAPADSGCQYVLKYPIAKSVLDGQLPLKAPFRFEIVESPDIEIENPGEPQNR